MSLAGSQTERPPILRALARPRGVALVCIGVLAACGWSYLGLAMASQQSAGLWRALCEPMAGAGGIGALLLTFAMWCAMVIAMMLPTAAPMVTTYADLTETAANKGEAAASPSILIAGYIGTWLAAALALTALQVLLTRMGALDPGIVIASPIISGALFVAAGAYQFSSVKHACLSHCQHPFRFFFANWTSEPLAIFRIGLRQGLYCLGCCWAMMLLMFAMGTMNVIWMAVLGAVMATEKLGTSVRFSRAVGVAFFAIGTIIIFNGWQTPD